MESRQNHPVWQVYDQLRTARFNEKILTHRLKRLILGNRILEIILAISAPSSAIAGLWFWNTDTGQIVWRYFGIIAAIAALLKPILSIEQSIQKYEELLSGYKGLKHDLIKIKEKVELRRSYDIELQEDYQKALERKGSLISKEPPSLDENDRFLKKKQEQVILEYPSDIFYVPDNIDMPKPRTHKDG